MSSVFAAMLFLLPTQAEKALDRFRAEHSGEWQASWNQATGYARFLSGSSITPSRIPESDEDYVALALEFLAQNWELFGIDISQLKLKAVNYSSFVAAGTRDKLGVEFLQEVAGVPVYQASVVVLFLPDGRITAVDCQHFPILEARDWTPSFSPSQAEQAVAAFFEQDFGFPATQLGEGHLAIYPFKTSGRNVSPRLAWIIEATSENPDPEGLPIDWSYVVSADLESAEKLDRWNEVHTAGELTGKVQGKVSSGLGPYNSNQLQTIPLKDLRVTSQWGGMAHTDAQGEFIIENQNQNQEVTARFNGNWVYVDDRGGNDAEASANFTLNRHQTLTLNPSGTGNETAEANPFYWVGKFHDFLEEIDPSYGLMDVQVQANVNVLGSCNAYYQGGSINFYPSGSGCVNSAYSTVIAHEEGHYANVLANSGNGRDGFGEGAADVWSLFICNTINGNGNDPLIGRDFFGPGRPIRNAEDSLPYCGDGNSGCHGEVHDDGEPLMGALWKSRQKLKQDFGALQGRDIANSLLVAWFKQYNQGEIDSIIETQWLTLDDDDGDLSNGTPHCAAIDHGFRQQGFPGFDRCCPTPPPDRSVVYVNRANQSSCENGSQSYPFNTVFEGISVVESGGELRIQSGNYPEEFNTDKPARLKAVSGVVRIGE